jgi:hypothetical protein
MVGRELPAGHLVWNKYGDKRDVNPANAISGTRAEYGQWLSKLGRNIGKPEIVAANTRIALANAISRDEVAGIELALAAGKSCRQVADELGRSTDLVNRIAKGAHIHQRQQVVRGASVFSWRPA